MELSASTTQVDSAPVQQPISKQKQDTSENNLVKEYVENLLDIVSEQLNQHRMEIETIDKLNHVTLFRQKSILISLTGNEAQEEKKEVK